MLLIFEFGKREDVAMSEKEMQQRRVADLIRLLTCGDYALSVLFSVNENVVSSVDDVAVPDVEQSTEFAPFVRIEIVKRMNTRNAVGLQLAHEKRIPEVRAGEVDDVWLERKNVVADVGELRKVEGFGRKSRRFCVCYPMHRHIWCVTIIGKLLRRHQMHIVAGTRHTVGKIGSVLVHPKGA